MTRLNFRFADICLHSSHESSIIWKKQEGIPTQRMDAGSFSAKGGTSPFIHFHSLYEKKKGTCKTESKFVTDSASYTISGRKKRKLPKTHGAIFGTASSFSILYFLFNEALDFRSKIFLLLFNAFAKLIADKANGFGILFLSGDR